ncbi:MAG: branched-chain amino acid aminotransferase [Chitinophagaceae bacterium]
MIAAMDIPVTKASRSKLADMDMNNLPFGKFFTDHMLVAEYENGAWKQPVIKPYGPIQLDPANAALHYGQSIFEGIKAYRNAAGEAFIFRPFDNYKRFNISAKRMSMPEVPEDIFIEGMRQLIDLERNWIPAKKDHSLYIRPFMFAADNTIGVKPADKYLFMIILSPTGPYYAAPMRIYVEDLYTRAAPGGIGFAKAAGNYASSLLAASEAKAKGFDQVLWTDAFEHKYVQEVGTMNVFFQLGNKIVTPGLENGAILAGVTRNSVITVLQELGYEVEERDIKIDELIEAYKAGELKEAFGTGTAATISMIKELHYKGYSMTFDTATWKTSPAISARMNEIREGKTEDVHGWMFRV